MFGKVFKNHFAFEKRNIQSLIFEFVCKFLFGFVQNEEGNSLFINSGRSSNSVAVVDKTGRNFEQNGVGNFREIKSSSSHVGGEQNSSGRSLFEFEIGFSSFFLVDISVKFIDF